MSLTRTPPKEEYVTLSLSTPQRQTLQTLLQLFPTNNSSVSQFDTTSQPNPPNPQSNRKKKNHPKKKYHPKFNPKKAHQRKNSPSFRKRYTQPPKFHPNTNNNNNNVKQETPVASNFNTSIVGPLLLAFLSQAKLSAPKDQSNQVKEVQMVDSKAQGGNETEKVNTPYKRFQYSSQLNPSNPPSRKMTPSRSPKRNQKKGKRVYWADEDNNLNNLRSNSQSPSRSRSAEKKKNNNYWKSLKISKMQKKTMRKAEWRQNIESRDNSVDFGRDYSTQAPVLKGILKRPKIEEGNNSLPPQKPLGNQTPLKRPLMQIKGDWECPNPRCRNINFVRRSVCNRCGITKPEGLYDDEVDQRFLPVFKKGDWTCKECSNLNFAKRSTCNMCYAQRPIETYNDFRPRKKINRNLEEGEIEQQEYGSWVNNEDMELDDGSNYM